MARFTNSNTDETVDFDVQVTLGSESAVVEGAACHDLIEVLAEWGKPGGFGDAEFAMEFEGTTLRGCVVERVDGSRRLTIDFMERE